MKRFIAFCCLLTLTLSARAQIHSWHGEYDASDDSGNCWGRAGGITFVPGVQGMAFSFNGTTDSVDLQKTAPLPPPWTLALWVRRFDAAGPSASLLSDEQTAIKLEQWNSGRTLGLTKFGVEDYAFNFVLPAGRWVHLTLVATATNTMLYIDGVRVQTLSASVNLPRGWFGGTGDNRLKAQVDEMQVWNEVLDADAVRAVSRQIFNSPARRREWSPPVWDAPQATSALTRNGEALGFHTGVNAPYSAGAPDSAASHYEGIARWEKPGRLPYLFLGRSGYDAGQGNMIVVEMGSRDRDGERLRSNRLTPGLITNGTEPPAADRVVRSIDFPYRSAGSLQIVGDILAVALEDPAAPSGLPAGRVMFYDVSDPLNPAALPVSIDSATHGISVTGMTRLPDGHYLVVTAWGSHDVLEFYRSTGTGFSQPGFSFELHDTWHPPQSGPGLYPAGHLTNYQCLSLLNQADGNVHMIGARNLSPQAPLISNPSDAMQLFRIIGWEPGNRISIQPLGGEIIKNCIIEGKPAAPVREETARQNGNFLAAAGPYVSPTGELLFYSSEFWNDGPGGCVRFCEFHHAQVARAGGPAYYPQAHCGGVYRVNEGAYLNLNGEMSLPVRVKPWIELYEDVGFGGASVMMDWDDFFIEDYQDLRLLEFDNKTSSLRWYAPPGYGVSLHDALDFGTGSANPVLALGSTTGVSAIGSLGDTPWNFDSADTRLSSLRFTSMADAVTRVNQPLTYEWSLLPSDSAFAVFDSIDTARPSFLGLNGPRLVTARLKVKQMGPFGAQTSEMDALIEVVNRAPAFWEFSAAAAPSSSGQQVWLQMRCHDPGPLDRHNIRVQWGDGSTQGLSLDARQSSVLIPHTYEDNDPAVPLSSTYVISATLSDDDGASVSSSPTHYRVEWRTSASTVDRDDDGLPDYWEDAHILTRNFNGTDDNDGDGCTNLDEYRAGTDPLDAADCLTLRFERNALNQPMVTLYARAINGPGYGTLARRYRLEYSTSLSSGVWTAVSGLENLNGNNVAITYTPPEGRRLFFRAAVWLQ